MTDIVFIGTQNSTLTASQIDKEGNKYFGIIDENNNCILIKKTLNSENSINLGTYIIIKQIEIGENNNIYLKCVKKNINNLVINNVTYGSSSSNPFIIVNNDFTINKVLWIDGIISFIVSNDRINFLILLDEYSMPSNIHDLKFVQPSIISSKNVYTYYLYTYLLDDISSSLMTITSGGSEISQLFQNVYLYEKNYLIITGFVNNNFILNIDSKYNIDLKIGSLILFFAFKNNTIIYDKYEQIYNVYINKIIIHDLSMYILCDIINDYVFFGYLMTQFKFDSVYKFKKAVFKVNMLILPYGKPTLLCITQSNNNTDVYVNKDEDGNLYYVTQTDDKGQIIINNDVYKTNSLKQIVSKFNTNGKLLWAKELKATPINNDLVKNMLSYNDNIYIFGIANNNSISLGNISYTSSDNQKKIYALEFTNKELFTNLTSESEFTPYETLDLIHISTITTDTTPTNTTNNKNTIIILSTFLGLSLLTIVILVLLYFLKYKKN